LVAVSGFALAGAAQVWMTLSKREKERELVFALGQFRQAIESYARASPGAQVLPEKLEDLLEDPRQPSVRRHLRRIYLDPMTGKAEWGLVMRQGRIAGVHSLSHDTPIGRTYQLAGIDFDAAMKYSDWAVAYIPGTQPSDVPGAQTLGAVPPGSALPAPPLPMPGAMPGTDVAPPAAPVPPSPAERRNTLDRDVSTMNERERTEYCTAQLNLDQQACQASRALNPLGRTQCMKTASQREYACRLGQTDLPPLYLTP
jgi:hypothetical protein